VVTHRGRHTATHRASSPSAPPPAPPSDPPCLLSPEALCRMQAETEKHRSRPSGSVPAPAQGSKQNDSSARQEWQHGGRKYKGGRKQTPPSSRAACEFQPAATGRRALHSLSRPSTHSRNEPTQSEPRQPAGLLNLAAQLPVVPSAHNRPALLNKSRNGEPPQEHNEAQGASAQGHAVPERGSFPSHRQCSSKSPGTKAPGSRGRLSRKRPRLRQATQRVLHAPGHSHSGRRAPRTTRTAGGCCSSVLPSLGSPSQLSDSGTGTSAPLSGD